MIAYDSAVEHLYALGHELHHGPSRKFELAHMAEFCRGLGNPERRFPSVLIAGTNGKGSTAATLASIAQASGHRTGLYTSPHLVRINERIQIGGVPVSDAEFAASFERVTAVANSLVDEGRLPHLPSFFETVTAMAFDCFQRASVELAVLEVGMGGRLDATNVVEPILSIITDIDLDHQQFLGSTIAAIAAEKAGILRAGVPAVTLPQHPQANQVLGERMIAAGARAVSATRNMAPVSPGSTTLVPGEEHATRFRHQVLGVEIEIVSPLVGLHQLRNLALALTAAEELAGAGFRITAQSIERGVRETRWPGRFQLFAATATRPEVLVDVAHNPAGAWALRSTLTARMAERPLVLLFGAMADKAVVEISQILWPMFAHVVLTRVNNPRAASTAALCAQADALGISASQAATVPDALSEACARARSLGPDAAVVVAGSIYLAGEVLPALLP